MSSFKFYLPSNACPDIYPNNTPTDFHINLDKPIELEGNWEVGVESIYYSSKIYDSTETATMHVKVEHLTRPRLNEVRSIRYRLSSDKKWLGFDGVTPTYYQPDPNLIESVLHTLNSLNDEILVSGKAFHFQRLENSISCELFDEGLFLHLSPRLAKLLGVEQIIGGRDIIVPYTPSLSHVDLTLDDYHVRYIHTSLQEKMIVTLQWNDGDSDIEGLKDSWKKAINYDMDLDVKHDRSIITNQHRNLAIDFSPRMRQTLRQSWPIIGITTSHATQPYRDLNVNDIKNGHWYVSIYTREMARIKRSTFKEHLITLYPWKSNSIRQLLTVMNRKVEDKLKQKLRRIYHSARHRFSLHLLPSRHVIMKFGKRLQISFSPKLAFLLGLQPVSYNQLLVKGERMVDALFNRARQLHVLCNIVKPTTIGNQQVQILRDFIHHRTNKSLCVKHFDTISYIPLALNRIDKLHVQVVNDLLKTVKLKDTKTLITLYFRKI